MLSSTSATGEIKPNWVTILTRYETFLYFGKYLYAVKVTNLIFIYLLLILILRERSTQTRNCRQQRFFLKFCDWPDFNKLNPSRSKQNTSLSFTLINIKWTYFEVSQQIFNLYYTGTKTMTRNFSRQ